MMLYTPRAPIGGVGELDRSNTYSLLKQTPAVSYSTRLFRWIKPVMPSRTLVVVFGPVFRCTLKQRGIMFSLAVPDPLKVPCSWLSYTSG